jgi:hypothetical protein
MTTFPALIPSDRDWSPGEYPSTQFESLSGRTSTVKHSNVEIGGTLRLKFTHKTEAEMLSILNHYYGQFGDWLAFPLPPEVWSGSGSPSDYVLENYAAKYIKDQPPLFSDYSCDGHDIEVFLEIIPGEGRWLTGISFNVNTEFLPGRPPIKGINIDVNSGFFPNSVYVLGIASNANTSSSFGVATAGRGVSVSGLFGFAGGLFINGFAAVNRGALWESKTLFEPGDAGVPMLLWSSRLTTATRTPQANGGTQGAIIAGIDGESFQSFFFEDASTTAVRVVVVKRDAKGIMMWQRWTSAEFGNNVTSRDVYPPQVVPVSDGGCVVLVGSNTGSIPMRVWRLAGDTVGSQLWAMDYTGNTAYPVRAAINSFEIVVLSASSVLLPNGISRVQPMLLRLSLASGAVLGGNAYRVDNSITDLIPGKRDDVFALSSGSIAFRVAQGYFLEVSSDTASVTRSVAFGGTGSIMNGVAALLPSGGFLVRSSPQMLVQLDSSFNIVNRFKHSNAMETGREFWGLQTLAIGVGADGVGYAISYNFGSGDYLGTGLTIVKFSSFGNTVIRYNEVAFGAGIGAPDQSVNHDLDIADGRGFVHLIGNTGQASGCRLTAIGFALDQPTSTAANTIPAATLATGSCGNTMSVRGWGSVTYSTDTPDAITRTVVSATVSSVTITNATGSLNMVDASGSLNWQSAVLYL